MRDATLPFDDYSNDRPRVRPLNVLLIMPRLVQAVGEGYQFPLGIAYISSCLKLSGFRVFTLNLNHRHGEVHDILGHCVGDEIDVVATGGISVQYNTIFDIVKSAKLIKPDVTTIVGGGLVTAEPDVAMRALKYADYGVIGEGEITVCELADALEHGASPDGVDGLIFKRDGQYVITAPREEIADIDSIPWPDYEGFELDKYLELPPRTSIILAKHD